MSGEGWSAGTLPWQHRLGYRQGLKGELWSGKHMLARLCLHCSQKCGCSMCRHTQTLFGLAGSVTIAAKLQRHGLDKPACDPG